MCFIMRPPASYISRVFTTSPNVFSLQFAIDKKLNLSFSCTTYKFAKTGRLRLFSARRDDKDTKRSSIKNRFVCADEFGSQKFHYSNADFPFRKSAKFFI